MTTRQKTERLPVDTNTTERALQVAHEQLVRSQKLLMDMISYTESRATETVPYAGLHASSVHSLYRATVSYADACALVRACTVAHAVASGTHRATPSEWGKSEWPDNLTDREY